ncbi:hypothetical protein PRK78_002416 [Emydomyces testavorans]|uniref:Peptidase S8/S53 domain-containing protein n=1 Tax=Emydomyces testavorans TaxID=2070801 RepID=A0AAF0DEA2_9EURO|nr:hypothetical protein PRK78_002416 [Emydomyces testavorans]
MAQDYPKTPFPQAYRSPQSVLTSDTADLSGVQDILHRHDASLSLLFGGTEERLRHKQAAVQSQGHGWPDSAEAPASSPYDLSTFYRVRAAQENLEALAAELRTHEHVDAAYVKPAGSPPVMMVETPKEAAPSMPPLVTPNFVNNQGYLKPAPEGIDATNYAHYMVGGQGEGIRIIDCEWGWRFTHEDLRENQGGVVAGSSTTWQSFVDHGTAVAGVLSGDVNQYGITGICPRAMIYASSFWDQATSTAIMAAADRLRPRDLILLEVHRGGPKSTGWGQEGYIAIEWWPDDYAAIRYATDRGIIVVEAAGNGQQDLDDPIYDARPDGFPIYWTNPFNPANPSSGAVVVGAGAPPPGTHGADFGPDRCKLWFSNYGRRVDAQGWGYEVTSTGYGWLQGGDDQDLWYTNGFSGTSSASPIVTGALACVQGILKDFDRRPLTPFEAIRILRETGSPQQDGPQQPKERRIGNRPDIRQLLQAALNR